MGDRPSTEQGWESCPLTQGVGLAWSGQRVRPQRTHVNTPRDGMAAAVNCGPVTPSVSPVCLLCLSRGVMGGFL